MRQRWVMARLREWAAWVECGARIPSMTITGMPRGAPATDRWIVSAQRQLRRTQKVVQQLPREHRLVIVLVYLVGPRGGCVTIKEIAEMAKIPERSLYRKIFNAEARFADALDALDESDDAMD